MKIFICSSKAFYTRLPVIIDDLESRGFSVILPNSFNEPDKELEMKTLGQREHDEWKAGILRLQAQKVASTDIILVINLDKNGIENYIGGSVLLEMYEAFRLNKKIYLWNPIPDNMLSEEIEGMQPIVIDGDLSKLTVY